MTLKLYGYWRSSATWRVRIGLNLKGIEYDYAPVHLVEDGGQQFKAGHTTRNPMQQVPVLELKSGDLLCQSLPILEFIEEAYPGASFFGEKAQSTDALYRARVRELAEVVNSGIQPHQNLSAMKKNTELGGEGKVYGCYWMEKGLAALNTRVVSLSSTGPFLLGEKPTLADICLIPQLYNARRFKLDLTALPRLLEAEAACSELGAFIDADPDKQADAQL